MKHARIIKRTLPIAKLLPHPKNPRKHPRRGSKAWEALKASLSHDYFDPLVWNRRNRQLVSGHLRRELLAEMGVEKVDVVVVDYDEPTHLARMSAANQHAGEFDDQALSELLQTCRDENVDVALAGVVDALVKSADAIPEKGHVQFSEFVGEANNYVVLLFNKEIDWLNALTHFKIKTVAVRGRNGKAIMNGTGRVIDGAAYLNGRKK